MAASEHLAPEQFGQYTIAHDDTQYRQVTAHTSHGAMAGYLHWEKESPPGWPGRPPTILGVQVDGPHRGKGLASALLQHALKYEPNLKHSHALTEDGKRFAKRNPL